MPEHCVRVICAAMLLPSLMKNSKLRARYQARDKVHVSSKS